jgi:hypothetical protein
MIYLSITLIIALVTIHILSRLHGEIVASVVPGGVVFLYLIFIASYGVGKIYCIEWSKISKNKSGLGLFVYEKFLFPFALVLFFVGKTPFLFIEGKPAYLILVILFFVFLGDWAGSIKEIIQKWYHGISELEARKLFINYPPASRIDMLPLDFLLNGVLLYMLYTRAFSN